MADETHERSMCDPAGASLGPVTNSRTMGAEGKPAVTAEQYARGREVLDALPSGVYVKCAACHRWQMGGEFTFRVKGVTCSGCR